MTTTSRKAAARGGRGSAAERSAGARPASPPLTVRPVRRGDVAEITAIDAAVTGILKRAYWRNVYRRYAEDAQPGAAFLVADAGGQVAGFAIGEVRDWEFGSPPCGWVFAIDVRPEVRLSGVGTELLASLCATFRRAGVRKVRTLLARDNTLVLSFFRAQGMMAAPLIPLEMDLPPAPVRSRRAA